MNKLYNVLGYSTLGYSNLLENIPMVRKKKGE